MANGTWASVWGGGGAVFSTARKTGQLQIPEDTVAAVSGVFTILTLVDETHAGGPENFRVATAQVRLRTPCSSEYIRVGTAIPALYRCGSCPIWL